jgi:hypothetical protein
MSGLWITNRQVEMYMNARNKGNNQQLAAAKAGISERSGRDIEKDKRHDPRQAERDWRTRKDPLDTVWDAELVPMLVQTPQLQPITLLEYLQGKYPGMYPDKCLRTLQRRVKHWKATDGPEKEVMFRQSHEPGRLSLSDFTHLKGISVIVNGKLFEHLLYHFRLSFSGWSHMKVIQGGESYAALAEGLQDALWRLGGTTEEHRTDSLSAAFKNLSKEAQDDTTQRYKAFCKYYDMLATRNNPGVGHENGSIESPHGHIKRRIKQAFLLRGSYDFTSAAEYQEWLEGVVNSHNQRNAKAILIEREHLRALPVSKTADYTEVVVRVSGSSTIVVKRALYTVPSQLKHEMLKVELYHDRLRCYLGTKHLLTLNRKRAKVGEPRARNVDYRHVIHSLAKKPQAFRRSQLRDDLLPTDIYKNIWQHVDATMPPKESCRFIVKLLLLAAEEKCEESLGEMVLADIESGCLLNISRYKDHYRTRDLISAPRIEVLQHPLQSYNDVINTEGVR